MPGLSPHTPLQRLCSGRYQLSQGLYPRELGPWGAVLPEAAQKGLWGAQQGVLRKFPVEHSWEPRRNRPGLAVTTLRPRPWDRRLQITPGAGLRPNPPPELNPPAKPPLRLQGGRPLPLAAVALSIRPVTGRRVPGPPRPLGPAQRSSSHLKLAGTLVRGLGTGGQQRPGGGWLRTIPGRILVLVRGRHQPESESRIFLTFSFMGRKHRILSFHDVSSGILSLFAA